MSAQRVWVLVVGGSCSGRTMLMMALVAGLQDQEGLGNIRIGFTRTADQIAFEDDLAAPPNGLSSLKRRDRTDRVWTLIVGRADRRYLVHLCTPSDRPSASPPPRPDAVLLVVDALADPGYLRSLPMTERDVTVLKDARPARESPMETYEKFTAEFAAMRRKHRSTPISVVVTKRDALDLLAGVGIGSTGPTRAWLTQIGLGNLVRALEHDFENVKYWAVSAKAVIGAVETEGRGVELSDAAEPILWLLE